jgi:hypothetical protein
MVQDTYKKKAESLFKLLSDEIKYDKEFIKKNLREFGEFYDSFGDLNDDIKFVMNAVNYNTKFLRHVPKDKITKEIVMKIFERNPKALLADFMNYADDYDVMLCILSHSEGVVLVKNTGLINVSKLNGRQILQLVRKSKHYYDNMIPDDYDTLVEMIEQDNKCEKSILPGMLICKNDVIEKYPQLINDILKKYPKFLKMIPREKLLCDEFYYDALLIDPKYTSSIYDAYCYKNKINNIKIQDATFCPDIPRDIGMQILTKYPRMITRELSKFHDDYEIMSEIVVPKYVDIIYYIQRSFSKENYDKLYQIALDCGYDTGTRHDSISYFN